MKYLGKYEVLDDVGYQWKMEEIKTERDCYKLAKICAEIGELDRIECQGYSDMDTHENYCSFKTAEEFVKGIEQVKKIDTDTISVFSMVDGKHIRFLISPVWDNEKGTEFCISGPEETVKKVSAVLQKRFG